MANPEHIEVLSRGVEVWNGWRTEHPDIRPDLRELSLRMAHPGILGLNLCRADFRNADLAGADLYRCYLVEADFTNANLCGAILGDVTAGGGRVGGGWVVWGGRVGGR